MKLLSLTLFLFIIGLSCKKDKQVLLSSQKVITLFELKAASNPGLQTDVTGSMQGDTIMLAVPSTIALTALVPSITHKGQSISPGSATAQNFLNPVVYTVTAADGSTKKYIVIVRFQRTTNEILSFTFRSSNNAGVLTQDAVSVIKGDSIWVTVDAFTMGSLIPSITHNGRQISPSGEGANYFLDPVIYTVTAENESTRKYTVVVRTTASVYVGCLDGKLYALDAGTGKLKWKYPLSIAVFLNPTYSRGTVYIGNSSYLYAINSTTGELRWRTLLPEGGATTNAQVVGNLVYIATTRSGSYPTSYMLAVDATTGIIRWQTSMGSDFILGSPTVADGRVVTATFSTGLRCFDAMTGASLWSYPMGNMLDNAAIVDGTLYIGSSIYRLIAIDMATGLKKWGIITFGENGQTLSGTGTSPTVHNGVVYFGDPLRAYDIATASLKWEYSVVNTAVLRPVCENGTIFGISPGDVVFAVNSNGTLKWSYGTTINVRPAVEFANPTVAHGVVFTGCGMNSNLIALNAANGQLIWSFEGGTSFTTGPCVVDGKDNAFHSSSSGAQQ